MITPDPKVAALLASLNAEFGKSKRVKRDPTDNEVARERNKEWHAANQPLGKAGVAARPDPEDSQAWRPIARVTHIYRQLCHTCNSTTEFIGAEFVRFRSVYGMNGGEILRRAENCPDLWFHTVEEPLEDVIEEHFESVSRCVGCIAVEKHAGEIWEAFLEGQRESLKQREIDFDVTKELPRSLDEALKEE
jgi:hypothetical protein